MRIVLRETANSREPLKHSRALETVDRAKLRKADWQFAIASQPVFVNENVSGTVHRLEAKLLTLDFDRAEHALGEVFQVSRIS